ncbi:MAG: hypothetical protein M0011_01545 [Elusimicrobia bacterium]|nr:hypothetical protein [Elusimicrobiota bacterium]
MMARNNAGGNIFSLRGDGQVYLGGGVGLGTTTPDQKLTVAGNISQTGVIISSGTGGKNYFAGYVGIGTSNPMHYLQIGDMTGQRTMQLSGGNSPDQAQVISLLTSGSREGYIAQTNSELIIGNTGGLGSMYTDSTLRAYGRFVMTTTGNIGLSTGVPQGRLDVLGTGSTPATMTQIWRNSGGTVISSMSDTGVMMAARFVGDGSGLTGAGDNLGTHVATKTLDMGGFQITNSGAITASSYTATGIGLRANKVYLNANVEISSATATYYGGVYVSTSLYVKGMSKLSGVVDTDTQFLGQPSDTVSAPSFSWTGDTNAGIYHPGTDILGFVTNGAERMRIESAGQIGGSVAMTMSSFTATSALGVNADKLYLNPNVEISSTTAAYYGGVYVSSHVYTPGNVYATKFYGDGSGLTGVPGDNLGNHIATNRLEMSNKAVDNVSSMTITGTGVTGTNPLFKVAGSTLAVLNNGYVGIGVASPGIPLEVYKARTGNDTLLTLEAGGIGVNGDATNMLFKGSGTGGAVRAQGQISGITELASGFTGALAFYTSPATDVLSERMRIDSSGNVGIGIATPVYKLDIADTTQAILRLDTNNASNGSQVILNRSNNARSNWVATQTGGVTDWVFGSGLYNGGSPESGWGVSTTSNLANAKFYIDTAGNVGIGTVSPAAKLDVKSSQAPTAAVLQVSSQNATGMLVVRADGKVGIGTTNPSEALDVSGNVKASIVKAGTNSYGQLGNGILWLGDPGGTSSFGNGSYPSVVWGGLDYISDVLTLGGMNIRLQTSVSSSDIGLYQNSNSNVGIGTTGPAAKLDVKSSQAPTAAVLQVSSQNAAGLFMVRADGNVGIGPTAPNYDLHVSKTVSGGVVRSVVQNASNTAGSDARFVAMAGGASGGDAEIVWDNGVHWRAGLDTSDSNKWKLSYNAALGTGDKLVVDTAGNMGVGTTSPQAKLDVTAYTAGTYTAYISTSSTAGQYSVAVSSTGITNIRNLVIENRTSDPAAPVTGQIWLRTN